MNIYIYIYLGLRQAGPWHISREVVEDEGFGDRVCACACASQKAPAAFWGVCQAEVFHAASGVETSSPSPAAKSFRCSGLQVRLSGRQTSARAFERNSVLLA